MSVTTDIRELNKYLVAQGLDAVAPRLPNLTVAQEAALSDDQEQAWRALRGPLVRQDIWEANLPDWYVTKHSYGLGHKAKIRERLMKRALPETVNVAVTSDRLSDDELIATLASLGLAALLPQAKALAPPKSLT